MDAELTEKISNAYKADYVGDVVFKEDELDELYSYVNQELRYFINIRGGSMPADFDKYMFVAMVNACKEWDAEEDTFFGYIYRKLLGIDTVPKVYDYIKKMLPRLAEGDNGIFYLDCYTKKYYATTIAHALAPKKSMESFFELCWKIYCDDMDYSFSRGGCHLSVGGKTTPCQILR